jgi:Rho-type GTPase-activating protein 1/2
LGALRPPPKTIREPYTNDSSEALPPSYSQAAGVRPSDSTRLSPTTSFLSQSLSVTAVSPPELPIRGNSSKPALEPHTDSLGRQLSRYSQQSSPLASPGLDSDKRTTYDDGIRSLHVFRDQQSNFPIVESLPSEALQSNVPTEGLFAAPGVDKRRSINLSLPLSPPMVLPSSASSDHSPKPDGLESQSVNYSAISSHLTAPDNSFKEKPSSRPPSRNDSIYSNLSAAGPMQDGRRSRSSSILANVDDTIVMSSPSSVTRDLDSSSKALTSAKPLPIQGEPQGKPSSATLSPIVQKRISSPSDISLEGRSANDSRSASPAHRVDVPRSVESGTDTENENEIDENENELKRPRILPPAPPPKDGKGTRSITYETEADINTSEMSQVGDISEDLLESLRVERMSHSTFIAPALPPIRFSLNTSDFSELLGSVGGMTSLKSLDDAALLIRQKQNDNAFTSPSLVATPTREGNATLPLSETSNSQAPISPAVHSSSDIYDDESSYPSDPRIYPDQTQITITEPESTNTVSLGRNTSDLIYKTLRESSNSAKKTGARHLHVDISLVDAIIKHIESQKAEYHNLTGKMEGMNVGIFPFFSSQSAQIV